MCCNNWYHNGFEDVTAATGNYGNMALDNSFGSSSNVITGGSMAGYVPVTVSYVVTQRGRLCVPSSGNSGCGCGCNCGCNCGCGCSGANSTSLENAGCYCRGMGYTRYNRCR